MLMFTQTDAMAPAWLREPTRVDEGPKPARLRRTAPTSGLSVKVEGLSKNFGDRQVLDNIRLDIRPGEFVAVVGRSGCGKSTLLRLLAGLDTASAGTLSSEGRQLDDHRKDVRIMFQDARLLPWKRVIDNVALGLKGVDAQQRARAALAQVGLADRAHDWPAQLSGGQRQRVALARALVHTPRLLLLDEPLGALDALTRLEMHELIGTLWRRQGFTALLVTHDVTEAVALADRVLLIRDGGIALDLQVKLPHPRRRGDVRVSEIEARILERVLQPQPATPADPAEPTDPGIEQLRRRA